MEVYRFFFTLQAQNNPSDSVGSLFSLGGITMRSPPKNEAEECKKPETNNRFRPRAVLTQEDAIEIYMLRKTDSNGFGVGSRLTGNTAALSRRYNVSPKTIRDIWNRRTWTPETRPFWEAGEQPMERCKPTSARSPPRLPSGVTETVTLARCLSASGSASNLANPDQPAPRAPGLAPAGSLPDAAAAPAA